MLHAGAHLSGSIGQLEPAAALPVAFISIPSLEAGLSVNLRNTLVSNFSEHAATVRNRVHGFI